MFVSKKSAKSASDEALKKGRESFIESLEVWHKKFDDNQSKLANEFELSSIQFWSLNVWDDFPEQGETYAYVEMIGVPNEICCELLISLLGYANNNDKIKQTGAKLRLSFFDSSVKYPALIGRRDAQFTMSKHWQLMISGINYEEFGILVDELKKAPPFKGKPLDVYSES